MSQLPLLIVDDSEMDRSLLAKALAAKGNLQILEASSGAQCLDLLSSQAIGLVLIDIMMPEMSGTDLLKKIRGKFNPIELPIIMVTSKSESLDVVGCLQAGANDYITKPVNFEVAISRISTHLKLAELSQEMSKLREMATLDSMITTYNHEINNVLTIAIGCLNSPDLNAASAKEKLKTALWRIADIVKKIKSVTEKRVVEFQPYGVTGKMLKLR